METHGWSRGVVLIATLATISAILLASVNVHLRIRLKEEAWRLNRTAAAQDQAMLFFNRVPKVASQTIMQLLDILAARNSFTTFTNDAQFVKENGENVALSSDITRRSYLSLLSELDRPATYSKHIFFLNFSEFSGYSWPIYMNMVREPVDRIASWYYYTRQAWYLVDKELKPDTVRRMKQPIEDCIRSGNEDCRFVSGTADATENHMSQMSFFCGQEPHCHVLNSRRAFLSAVHNVNQYYAVVGVLEDMEKTMIVLEHYIPRFFAGAAQVYRDQKALLTGLNRNHFRPRIDQSALNALRRNMSYETDFYHFCRQRLHKQYQAIGSPALSPS